MLARLSTLARKARSFSSLVSPSWVLSQQSASDSLIVLDCAHPTDYDRGHIPSSKLFSQASFGLKGSGGCVSERYLKDILQDIGYDSSKTLVLYDNFKNLLSSRAWWILSHYGIPREKIKVLDGGLKNWVASGNPVATNTAENKTAEVDATENKIARIQLNAGDKLIGIDEIQTLLNEKDGVFIDSRAEEEFSGQFLFGNARGGHIPGALHFEWIGGIDGENNDTFKSEEQLREQFPELWETQRNSDTPIVSYCQMGVRAANVAFMLEEVCGFKNVKVYEKSMQEYMNREGVLIE
uniref:Uncharacterized protein AlNc14C506G11971 n=1 Tax=Albugo laibachii Nc14 TaxID=890382 RepID=F0X0M6_9STRA|nr:conserved hypothetical protein [Albugo laibachii Nc14]|eukprot:CCA27318.1 conserved hypothetical protein [Albugo laibachii Nc14]